MPSLYMSSTLSVPRGAGVRCSLREGRAAEVLGTFEIWVECYSVVAAPRRSPLPVKLYRLSGSQIHDLVFDLVARFICRTDLFRTPKMGSALEGFVDVQLSDKVGVELPSEAEDVMDERIEKPTVRRGR